MAETPHEPPASATRQFYQRVTSSISIQLIGLAIGFLGSIILARLLGPEGRGIVSWIISYHIIGAALSQVGMTHVNRRFAAEYPERSGELMRLTLALCSLAALLLIPLFLMIAWQHPIAQKTQIGLILAVLSMPILAMADALGDLCIGLHRAGWFNRIMISQKVVGVCLLVFFSLTIGLDPLLAILAMIGAVWIKWLVALWLLRKEWQQKRSTTTPLIRQVSRYLTANYVASLALLFTTHGVIIMLGVWSDALAVGLFATAYVLIEAGTNIPRLFSYYALPQIVQTTNRAARAVVKRQFLFVIGGVLILGCIGGVLIAEWLIPFLFGSAFDDSVPVLRVLLIGLFGMGMLLMLQAFINAEDHSWRTIAAPICVAVVTVSTAPWCITHYAALGGAISWSLGIWVGMFIAIFLAIHSHRNPSPQNEE